MQTQPGDHSSAVARAAQLFQQGRHAEAARLCQAVVRAEPDHAQALHLFGLCLMHLGDVAVAERAFAASLASNPDDPAALANHGVALFTLQRFDDAVARYTRALAIKPADGMLHWNRARALAAGGRSHEALCDFERADELLGRQEKLLHEMLATADRLLSSAPGDRAALLARGSALCGLRRWRDALEVYQPLLAHDADNEEALRAVAAVYLRLERPDDALNACERALLRDGSDVPALSSRAAALANLGHYQEAIATLDRAIELDPNDAGLHWNRALYRLVQGEFAQAWPDFEWRWQRSPYLKWLRQLPERLWDGREDVRGKTILLHSEQGFGDAIQMVRYVPLLAARGAQVIVGAHAPLKPLLETVPAVAGVIVNGEEMPQVDLHCPLVSLPARFGTTLETIPASVPYLRTDARRVRQWSERIGPRRRIRVGLAWSGSPTHDEDHRRSMQLDALGPLFEVPAEFHCLGKFVTEEERAALPRFGIRHYGEELTDFAETAALASLMDLVISVDTSIAHLAGALALPVWLLISNPPEWRWMLEREDSPWYPTARLFRQRTRTDWADVVARVAQALAARIAESEANAVSEARSR